MNWRGLHHLPWKKRLQATGDNCGLDDEQLAFIKAHYSSIGDQQVENYLYNFGVPTGLLVNLPVDHGLHVVTMATEEPSVIAAANNGARMMRYGDGVETSMEQRLVRGQIVVINIDDLKKLERFVSEHKEQLLKVANDSRPSMRKRGGGAVDLLFEPLDEKRAIVNLLINPKEAMGANVVNTMAEAVAHYLQNKGYEILMAILSNYATEAQVKGTVRIPFSALQTKDGLAGSVVARRIAEASYIETLSPYRAVTANKGILNGIEAVVLASGNDTRAVNAALHAHAASQGRYRGLIRWQVEGDALVGRTSLPMLVGSVGGSIGIVPAVKINRQIMGQPTANELTRLLVAVGLAQNLAALRALVTTGIQDGHMGLQAKSLALEVGAELTEVPVLVKRIKKAGHYDSAFVKQLLMELRNEESQ